MRGTRRVTFAVELIGAGERARISAARTRHRGNTGISFGATALVASGGLCAPLNPFYTMPSFAARSVRDALPTFTTIRNGCGCVIAVHKTGETA